MNGATSWVREGERTLAIGYERENIRRVNERRKGRRGKVKERRNRGHEGESLVNEGEKEE